MKLKIAVSSGKGGTGKTFIATNLSVILKDKGYAVHYLDCDVEAPNGHLFLKPQITKEEDVTLLSPFEVDMDKCTRCGKCAKACHYNAIAVVKDKVLIFNELCHACGACKVVCPVDAIVEKEKKIGTLREGRSDSMDFCDALLETGQGGMSPRLVKKVKEYAKEGINVFDSPPGTSCSVVETVKDVDLCILATDPTPFGINDLKLAVDMARITGQEPVVLINRVRYYNNDLKDYCRKEDLKIIGEIPDDRKIAEVYSRGDIVVKQLPQYQKLFEDIALKALEYAQHKRKVRKISQASGYKSIKLQDKITKELSYVKKSKELVVISGKGGTGKTSLTSSFAALAKNIVVADCDVDAADLHIILKPEIKKRGYFSGSVRVEINQDKCRSCGRCKEVCRFEAIEEKVIDGVRKFFIDSLACEGCGTCILVCKYEAIKAENALNGEWFISQTRFGPMSHAKLKPAEENSGRLVTLVRNNASYLAQDNTQDKVIIDGAPGTGCPVISSLTGADYALIVTEPTVSGIHDMRRVLDVTRHFGIRSGVVVNKYDLNMDISENIKSLSAEYNAEFMGVIPYDEKVTEAQSAGVSLIEYSECETSKRIKEIWKKVSALVG